MSFLPLPFPPSIEIQNPPSFPGSKAGVQWAKEKQIIDGWKSISRIVYFYESKALIFECYIGDYGLVEVKYAIVSPVDEYTIPNADFHPSDPVLSKKLAAILYQSSFKHIHESSELLAGSDIFISSHHKSNEVYNLSLSSIDFNHLKNVLNSIALSAKPI